MTSLHRFTPGSGLLRWLLVIALIVGIWRIGDSIGAELGMRRVEQDSTPQSVATSARGMITGKASDAAGAVPDDLQVCAAPNLGGPSTCVTPGADGTYFLTVLPGQYTVTAIVGSKPRDHGTYTEQVAGVTKRHRAMVIDVAEHQTLTDINPTDWSK